MLALLGIFLNFPPTNKKYLQEQIHIFLKSELEKLVLRKPVQLFDFNGRYSLHQN